MDCTRIHADKSDDITLFREAKPIANVPNIKPGHRYCGHTYDNASLHSDVYYKYSSPSLRNSQFHECLKVQQMFFEPGLVSGSCCRGTKRTFQEWPLYALAVNTQKFRFRIMTGSLIYIQGLDTRRS